MKPPDPKLVAVRAAAAAIEPFREEFDRMDLIWRVCRVLDLPKDVRPCCPCDEAPCIHQREPCSCWACRQLFALHVPRRDRDPRHLDEVSSTAGETR